MYFKNNLIHLTSSFPPPRKYFPKPPKKHKTKLNIVSKLFQCVYRYTSCTFQLTGNKMTDPALSTTWDV